MMVGDGIFCPLLFSPCFYLIAPPLPPSLPPFLFPPHTHISVSLSPSPPLPPSLPSSFQTRTVEKPPPSIFSSSSSTPTTTGYIEGGREDGGEDEGGREDEEGAEAVASLIWLTRPEGRMTSSFPVVLYRWCAKARTGGREGGREGEGEGGRVD